MQSSRKDERIEKIFPDYFNRFVLPEGAREECIPVYRACKSGKCDRESFLPTFEENNFLKIPTMLGGLLLQIPIYVLHISSPKA